MIQSFNKNIIKINSYPYLFLFLITSALNLPTTTHASEIRLRESLDQITSTKSSPTETEQVPPPATSREELTQIFRIHTFQDEKPKWGVEIAVSGSALGGNTSGALTTAQGSSPTYAASVFIEYQPPFIQKYGVLGIGPYGSFYPIPGGAATSNFASVFGVGGQIRYQARYFREQPLVPVVGYALEYFKYNFKSGANGSLLSQGPFFGLWFLLNCIEESAASQFYVNTGILRSYLIFEARYMTGSNSADQINFFGPSYYGGIRFEF